MKTKGFFFTKSPMWSRQRYTAVQKRRVFPHLSITFRPSIAILSVIEVMFEGENSEERQLRWGTGQESQLQVGEWGGTYTSMLFVVWLGLKMWVSLFLTPSLIPLTLSKITGFPKSQVVKAILGADWQTRYYCGIPISPSEWDAIEAPTLYQSLGWIVRLCWYSFPLTYPVTPHDWFFLFATN